MANMQCDITELIEKLSDEARLYLLKRMASRNLSLRQVLLELVIGISREAASGSKEQETACSACFIPHLTPHGFDSRFPLCPGSPCKSVIPGCFPVCQRLHRMPTKRWSQSLPRLQRQRQVRQHHLPPLRRQGHCPYKRTEDVSHLTRF